MNQVWHSETPISSYVLHNFQTKGHQVSATGKKDCAQASCKDLSLALQAQCLFGVW